MDWGKEKLEVEAEFNRVKALKEQTEATVKSLEQRMFQLQGRHALVCEVLAAQEKAKVDAEGNSPN